MPTVKSRQSIRDRRHRRVRARVSGTAERPRVVVFKSSQHTYAQAVDDRAHRTLVSASSVGVKPAAKAASPAAGAAASANKAGAKERRSLALGMLVAEKLKALGVKTVVFDRGGFKYHGRIKAVAEGLRQGGLTV